MRYDDVISLGGNCEVAEHWRRFSGDQRAFPFDWWITPLPSVERILAGGFRNMCLTSNMKVINFGRTVMCTHYCIAHHHDFPRVEGPSALIDTNAMADACANAQQKYTALGRRFREACAPRRKVLFIRSWRETLDFAPTAYAPDDLVRYDFDRLVEAIANMSPDLDFKVLFVNYGPQRSDHPRTIFHNVEDKGDSVGWSGSPGGWDDMFRLHVA